MTFTLALVGLGCFVVGIACGILLRDAYELAAHGEGFIMSTARRAVHQFGTRRLLSVLLLVALLLNAVVGFALIGARAKADRAERAVSDLSNCLESYNRREGDARNERDRVAKRITATEVVLWEQILAVFKGQNQNGSGVVLKAIVTYLDQVHQLQDTRLENPYPDPALCLPKRAD